MKNIATYYRISDEDIDLKTRSSKDESNSITSQRAMVQAFLSHCKDLASLPVLEFFDDGCTGTNFDRPQFQAMLRQIKSGTISCVIVKDLSRFGRDYLAVGDYLDHIFPFLGVRFISLNDGYDSADYVGQTSGMDMAFRNLIYDSYSKDLSKKVKSAMFLRMEQGKYVNHPPYGYQKAQQDKHQMIPDPGSAPIVQRIFSMALAGSSTAAIATTLNADSVPTPAQYKRHRRKEGMLLEKPLMWTHRGVLAILQNIKYTGTMVNHTRESRKIRDKTQRRVPPEEWMTRENAHEALVSAEVFEQVQQRLRSPRKSVKQPSGEVRVFYCAHCGRKLRLTYGLDRYYSCDTPTYQQGAPCAGIRWSKTALENTLLASFRSQVALVQSEAIARKKAASPTLPLIAEIKSLSKQLAGYEEGKISLYEAYRSGTLPKDAYLARKQDMTAAHEALAQRLRDTERKLEDYENAPKPNPMQNLRPEDMTTEALRETMYRLIDRVLIWDNDRIEILWAFSDPFQQENSDGKTA